MKERIAQTRKGISFRVREAGSGPPLVYLHGIIGLLEQEDMLDALAERFHVFAPVWPGYGEEDGEESIEDMLDFTLHGLDVLEALELERPHVVGHSFGGMIAAEMACANPSAVDKLALLAPYGIWNDDHPIGDVFAATAFDLPPMLFQDAEAGQKLLAAGLDFSDNAALTAFMVGNARRLGTAGKILFPVPNRRLSKRLYRLIAPTLIVWGSEDRLIPPIYAKDWQAAIPQAEIAEIANAAHMLPYEAPAAAAEAILKFM